MPGRHRLVFALASAALVFGMAAAPEDGGCEPPGPGPLPPPAAEEFVVIPLRVHVLTSADLPEVDCALADADIARVVGKVNGIWRQAGVYWALGPIVREPAARVEQFKEARDQQTKDPLTMFKILVPEATRSTEGMDVYYIHRFSVNGVYLGDRMAFVQETARLRPVPGGIDEPLPRVTAHELGHGLGLPHRQAQTNLLASGTTGTTLNEAEVARARDRARKVPGALAVPDLRKKADDAQARGDRAEARRLWLDLAAIPGEGADEARRRAEAIVVDPSPPDQP